MSLRRSLIVSFIVSSMLFGVSVCAQTATDAVNPELPAGASEKTLVTAEDWMVAAANPHAVNAGAQMLREGGNAIDAMVATQLVLGLVEPQSSGLGGGAFLVYWDAASQSLTTFDGRETAPLAATPQLFQDEAGKPLKFFDAVVGGRSVGTPGTLKLLHHSHARYGKLSWRRVIEPALSLAMDGFEVSNRLAILVANDSERLSRYDSTSAYFFPNGEAIREGDILKNPAYADTLSQIAEQGPSAFYNGPIAQAIVAAVQGVADNPGLLSLADLANYQVKERPAVCVSYREVYDVCGMGPPSSGALTVGQILGILNSFDLAELGPTNPESWRLIGDASRLAFADRGRYMADSDFVPMPLAGLLDPEYLKSRAELITGDAALSEVSAGSPPWAHAMHYAPDEAIEFPSTSHFSIVDSEGNVVSMTTTIENGFGSRLMAAGFLLNNELTDFSFRSQRDGVPIANRVEPGKRPRSSMSPTIVFENGQPILAIGSPGGSRIIGYVAQALISQLDWGMNVQDAINQPHLVNRFGTYDLEQDTSAVNFQEALEALGYNVGVRSLTSGLHGIRITEDGLEGGADPRREGVVVGE